VVITSLQGEITQSKLFCVHMPMCHTWKANTAATILAANNLSGKHQISIKILEEKISLTGSGHCVISIWTDTVGYHKWRFSSLREKCGLSSVISNGNNTSRVGSWESLVAPVCI
jgi:hypothetical protein